MSRKTSPTPVQATYDEDVDALAFNLIPTGKTAKTIEVMPGLYVDIDTSGAILAIEVLKASSKYSMSVLRRLPTPGPLLTLTEAARIVSLSPATIRKQIHNQRVAATKHGRDWFVSKRDLLSYVKTKSPRGRRATTGAA
jgi:excisionase family DNA binding protein